MELPCLTAGPPCHRKGGSGWPRLPPSVFTWILNVGARRQWAVGACFKHFSALWGSQSIFSVKTILKVYNKWLKVRPGEKAEMRKGRVWLLQGGWVPGWLVSDTLETQGWSQMSKVSSRVLAEQWKLEANMTEFLCPELTVGNRDLANLGQ